jgi:hypothetical protein
MPKKASQFDMKVGCILGAAQGLTQGDSHEAMHIFLQSIGDLWEIEKENRAVIQQMVVGWLPEIGIAVARMEFQAPKSAADNVTPIRSKNTETH